MKNKIIIATIKSWNINDDNILGCDSSIKRFKKQGYVSYFIISREIVISRDNVRSRKYREGEIGQLKRNLHETNKLFNISETINIKLKTLEKYKLKIKGASYSRSI